MKLEYLLCRMPKPKDPVAIFINLVCYLYEPVALYQKRWQTRLSAYIFELFRLMNYIDSTIRLCMKFKAVYAVRLYCNGVTVM